VFASFYIHHRVIRVRVSDRSVVMGGSSRADAFVLEKDIARVKVALGG
jgi:hypothetical protein